MSLILCLLVLVASKKEQEKILSKSPLMSNYLYIERKDNPEAIAVQILDILANDT